MTTSDEQSPDGSEPTFADFEIDGRLLEQLASLEFLVPTPIQLATIPTMLAGRDVIGRARTGSGKTAAFGLPLLERVKDGGKTPRALVLAPTRELAQQVGKAIQDYGAKLPKLRIATIYGGAPYPPQIRALSRGCSIVTGTPGRMIDLLNQGVLRLSGIEVVVLDEADEMLRMGFIEAVKELLAACPEGRQVALFSATMPPAIRRVASKYLRDPVELQVEEKANQVDHIEQQFLYVHGNRRVETLIRILEATERRAALVFVRTRISCVEVADALSKRGFSAGALNGDLSQTARDRVLGLFRRGSLDILVGTDVAARGLDVPHLSHVINLDLPENTETYVHRIGRTGRAGRTGVAITFVPLSARRFVPHIERALSIRFQEISVPSDVQVALFQRSRLEAELAQIEAPSDEASVWLNQIATDRGWSAEETCARALEGLARRDGIALTSVTELDDRPPSWSSLSRPNQRTGKNRRDDRPTGSGDRARLNEVQIFVAAGSRHGVRPSDLVGALANETGMPGHEIGQIHITPAASFVGLPKEVADTLLASHPEIEIRGNAVTISLSRTQPPDGDNGGARSNGPGGRSGRGRNKAKGRGRSKPKGKSRKKNGDTK
jgi:ATP-dependent RNA helicase DeaD